MRRELFLAIGTAIALVGSTGAGGAAVADPDEIVARMRRFVTIELCTSQDPVQREDNLLNTHYLGCGDGCPTSSDIYTQFLDGQLEWACWYGMPYAYGRGDTPDDEVQAWIDQGSALGNHQCHYQCWGCVYPGCDWSVGVDCSAAVCYALGIPRVGSYGLDSDDVGVPCDPGSLQRGCYLVKPGAHVMLVSDVASHTVIEATGAAPVVRETARYTFPELFAMGYVARLPIAVADAQGSDGFLIAEPGGAAVHLVWHVDSCRNSCWYEFQFFDSARGRWRTFAERDAAGPGDYRATYTGPGAADLVYRVCEHQRDGRRIVHGETRVSSRGKEAS